MREADDRIPDLSMYVPLVDRFLAGEIDGESFMYQYMAAFQSDHRLLGEPWYPILNDLFLDADQYVEDPGLRGGGAYELDDQQFLERVRAGREKLRHCGAG